MPASPLLTEQQPLIGLASLARQAMAGLDLTPIAQQLAMRVENDSSDASALMDLATIHFLWHQPEAALGFQHAGMALRRRYVLADAPQTPALRLLALHGDGDLMDNLPVEFLLIDSNIAMDLYFVATDDALPDDLGDYDMVLVAVGESDRTKPLLAQLKQQLQACPVPVINHPAYIMQTTREDAASALQGCPGVVMPMSTRIDRADLLNMVAQQSSPLPLPFIIRPVESHAGHGLARLDRLEDLACYLDEQAGESLFYISPFIDYSSADGCFRKYRVVLIQGESFLAHQAISSHWIVHYLNAGMLVDTAKQAEEAASMAHFDEGFGKRHRAAFHAIYQWLPVDYLIIDCAETDDGELLVFEVDTSAIVHDMDPADQFPYKQPQMRKIFAAFQAMLVSSAER